MLNAEQRDYLVKLFERESEPNVRAMLQAFSEMHNRIKDAHPLLTDISVDLLDMGLDLHRAGHQDAAYAVTQLAGVIIKPNALKIFCEAAHQAQLMVMANIVAESVIEQFTGKKPKRRKKKRKQEGDGGEQSSVS